MSVAEELHDGRGHEVKGKAVEQGMRGVHVREAGREEGPYATGSDVAHVDAKVVEHESEESSIAGGTVCLRCKGPGEVDAGVDCNYGVEDELAVEGVEPVRAMWTTPGGTGGTDITMGCIENGRAGEMAEGW